MVVVTKDNGLPAYVCRSMDYILSMVEVSGVLTLSMAYKHVQIIRLG